MTNKNNKPNINRSPDRSSDMFTSPSQSVAIYTILRLLLKIRNQFGLEAMLEYLAQYVKNIERKQPRVRFAVDTALKMMCMEKIYEDTMHEGHDG